MIKVLVGLSGGVDSAVAAYLLKKQGYDVTCLFMRNWDSALNNDTLGNPTLNNDICPQEKDFNDAQSVAEALGLKLLRMDYIKEYWENVFQKFLVEYENGRTPNPDILCNKYIKFDAFLNYALNHGYDYIATGHYVKKVSYDCYEVIAKADDMNKDQSYFLAQISPFAISKTLFPLGTISKPEVRKIADELKLSVAGKKDSTGVCFIGERNFQKFLSNYLPMSDGDIIDIETKTVIGRHHGSYYYTIGQRKGFNVGGNRGPYFLVGKDVYKNELYLASIKDEHYLYSDECLVIDFNQQFPYELDGKSLKAKFRYRQPDQDVKVEVIDNHTLKLKYPQKIKAVAIGQEAVLYLESGEMLGGGVIDKTFVNGIESFEFINNKLNS